MKMTRRAVIGATGLMVAAATLKSPGVAYAAAPLTLPPLPFAEDALAPHISAKTVSLHYHKHHATYFKKLNDLVKGTSYADLTLQDIVVQSAGKDRDKKIFNNAAQAWNHIAYWDQFVPGGSKRPEGKLKGEIDQTFGDYAGFVEKAIAASDAVFGTGWVWLSRDDAGKLALIGYEDAHTPVALGRPAYLGIDIWEHAYYVDYENRKPEHIKAVLENIVNWNVVADRVSNT